MTGNRDSFGWTGSSIPRYITRPFLSKAGSAELAVHRIRFVPFLGALPLHLDTRVAGDSGTPIAAGDSDLAKAYGDLAKRLVDGGMA